jgi:opacity protein-like surface antigen
MKKLVCTALLLGLTGPAMAEGFNYNFVSASYGTVDFDDIDVDGNIFDIGLSLAISENFHVFGNYESADLDFGVDASGYSAGIGFNTPISNVIDVVAQVSYEYAEVDVGFDDADDNGYGLAVGLRAAVSEAVELNAGLKYVDFGDGGDGTALGAAFLFNLTESIALGLAATWDDDVTSYSLGGRVYFGN